MSDRGCECCRGTGRQELQPPDPRWVSWLGWTMLALGLATLTSAHFQWPWTRLIGAPFFVLFCYGLPIVARGRARDDLSLRARLVFSAIFGTAIVGPVAYALATGAHP